MENKTHVGSMVMQIVHSMWTVLFCQNLDEYLMCDYRQPLAKYI